MSRRRKPARITPPAPVVEQPTLTVAEACPEDADAIEALFTAAIAADPDYAPVVTSGEISVAEFLARKPVTEALLAWQGDRVVGHVAARTHRVLPGGTVLSHTRPMEMCRLVVHPDATRTGIATVLVRAMHRRYGAMMWATCHAGYASHALLSGLGWIEHETVTWDDDPRAGVCLFAPDRLAYPAPSPAHNPRTDSATPGEKS